MDGYHEKLPKLLEKQCGNRVTPIGKEKSLSLYRRTLRKLDGRIPRHIRQRRSIFYPVCIPSGRGRSDICSELRRNSAEAELPSTKYYRILVDCQEESRSRFTQQRWRNLLVALLLARKISRWSAGTVEQTQTGSRIESD